MKKIIIYLLSAIFVFTLGMFVMSGCGKGNVSDADGNSIAVRGFESFEEISYGAVYSYYFGKVTLNTDKRFVRSGSGSAKLEPIGCAEWNMASYAYQQRAQKPSMSIVSKVKTRPKYDIADETVYPISFKGYFYNASGEDKNVYPEIAYSTDKGIVSRNIIQQNANPEIIAKDSIAPTVLKDGEWTEFVYDCTADISDLWAAGYDVDGLESVNLYFDIYHEGDVPSVIYADDFSIDVYTGEKPAACELPDYVDRGQSVELPKNETGATYEVYLNDDKKIDASAGKFNATANEGDFYRVIATYPSDGGNLKLTKKIPVRYADELESFESFQSVHGITTSGAGVVDNYSRYTSMIALNTDPEYVISGRSSLKIVAPYYDYKDSWPFLGFEKLQITDISDYYSVSMWIYNDDSVPVNMKLLDYYGYVLQPYAWNKIELTTAQIAAITGRNVANNKDVTTEDVNGLNLVYTLNSSQTIKLYVDAIKVNSAPDATEIALRENDKTVEIGEKIVVAKPKVIGAPKGSVTRAVVTLPDGTKEEAKGEFYCRKAGKYYVDYITTDSWGNGATARYSVDVKADLDDISVVENSSPVDLSVNFGKINDFTCKIEVRDSKGNDCSSLLDGNTFSCSIKGVYTAKYTITGSNVDDFELTRLIVVYEDGERTGFDFEDGLVPDGFTVTDYNASVASTKAFARVTDENAYYSDLSLKIDCNGSYSANLLITSPDFLARLKECKYFTFRIYSTSQFTLKIKDQQAYFDTDVCNVDANCWVKVKITPEMVVKAFNTEYSDGSVKSIQDVTYLKLYGFNCVYIDNIRFYK